MLVLVLASSPRVIGGQIQEMLFREELLPAVPEDGRRVYTRATKDLWGGKGGESQACTMRSGISRHWLVIWGEGALGVLFVPSSLRVSCKYVGVGGIGMESLSLFEITLNHNYSTIDGMREINLFGRRSIWIRIAKQSKAVKIYHTYTNHSSCLRTITVNKPSYLSQRCFS